MKIKNNKVCQDHLGNAYISEIARADHYGISHQIIRYRLAHGWTLEEALTTSTIHLTMGERKIKDWCDRHGYRYEYNTTIYHDYDSCGNLHTDFAIIANGRKIPVEFDGRQHFLYIDHFDRGLGFAQFLTVCKRDDKKNAACINHNIPLLRISYLQMDKVDNILDMFFTDPDKYVGRLNPLVDNTAYYAQRDQTLAS